MTRTYTDDQSSPSRLKKTMLTPFSEARSTKRDTMGNRRQRSRYLLFSFCQSAVLDSPGFARRRCRGADPPLPEPTLAHSWGRKELGCPAQCPPLLDNLRHEYRNMQNENTNCRPSKSLYRAIESHPKRSCRQHRSSSPHCNRQPPSTPAFASPRVRIKSAELWLTLGKADEALRGLEALPRTAWIDSSARKVRVAALRVLDGRTGAIVQE